MNSQAELRLALEPDAQPETLSARIGRWLRAARRAVGLFGPVLVLSAGYVAPGNWAVALAGGARFGYRLLWLLLLGNLMAILLQSMAAKLSIATGKNLAQLCRERYGRSVAIGLWLTAEAAQVATDLAEFLGVALGLHLLCHIPLLTATLLAGLDVLLLLALQRWGHRGLEFAMVGLVALVGWLYLGQLFLFRPDLPQVIGGLFTPGLDAQLLYVAIAMLGATLAPHHLYLHSALVRDRLKPVQKRRIYRSAVSDSVMTRHAPFFVNAAILITAGAVFSGSGTALSLHLAHRTLQPLLGAGAAGLFAAALLTSGLASANTGAVAGQIAMEGFLAIKWEPWVRRIVIRLLTLGPVLVAVALGADLLKVLLLSQVVLCFQLPFVTVPLLHFTSENKLMGEFVNGRWVKVAAVLMTTIVIAMNGFLIYLAF